MGLMLVRNTSRAGTALMPLALLLSPGCVQRVPPPGHDDVLVGLVRAPVSFELPAGAVVRVMLLDIDAPDVPDYIIAAEEHAVSVFPATLEVHYDPHGLVPHITYGLAAELRVGETLLADCEPVPVATKGNPTSVELVLVLANR